MEKDYTPLVKIYTSSIPFSGRPCLDYPILHKRSRLFILHFQHVPSHHLHTIHLCHDASIFSFVNEVFWQHQRITTWENEEAQASHIVIYMLHLRTIAYSLLNIETQSLNTIAHPIVFHMPYLTLTTMWDVALGHKLSKSWIVHALFETNSWVWV